MISGWTFPPWSFRRSLLTVLLCVCRREAVPVRVRRLRPEVCQQQRPKEAHARPHVGQALPVQDVRQVVHAPQLAPETHEGKGHGSILPSKKRASKRLERVLFLSTHRSTSPRRRRRTPHQQQAPDTSPPPPRALCPPPPRATATPRCPRPRPCTTRRATAACPPTSVSGTCEGLVSGLSGGLQNIWPFYFNISPGGEQGGGGVISAVNSPHRW